MRFWDSSAVMPLLADEATTSDMRAVLGIDDAMVVWWGTRVECSAGLRRKEREKSAHVALARRALERLNTLSSSWSEIEPGESLRVQAERALGVHPLRAGDALQLAAAKTWRAESPARLEFVCLDERLRDAASREGFAVLPAE